MTDATVRKLAPSFPDMPVTTGRFRHHIHRPGRLIGDFHIVNRDAERDIQAHALLLRSVARGRAPRGYLGQGPMNAGKSQLIANALLSMGTAVLIVGPDVLASKHEDGAIDALTEIFTEAANHSRLHREPIAVLFDDVDASILAVNDNVGRTTATASASGYLQFIADHHELFTDFMGCAIPLFMTANAAGQDIRPSLFREGRAIVRTFRRDPNLSARVAYRVLRPADPRDNAIVARLLDRYPTEGPAFWTTLYHAYVMAMAASIIDQHGGNVDPINTFLANPPPLDERLLTRLAKRQVNERPGVFFVTKRRSFLDWFRNP